MIGRRLSPFAAFLLLQIVIIIRSQRRIDDVAIELVHAPVASFGGMLIGIAAIPLFLVIYRDFFSDLVPIDAEIRVSFPVTN